MTVLTAAVLMGSLIPIVAAGQNIRLIDSLSRFVSSVTDGLAKQPELCLVLVGGSVVGVASIVLLTQPKLVLPVKRVTSTPEEAEEAEKEFQEAMYNHNEAKLFRQYAFKGILVLSGVIVVGTMYIAVRVSDKAAAHQELLASHAAMKAEYTKNLSMLVAKSHVQLSSVLPKVLEKVWAHSNGSLTSFAVVVNDTLQDVFVHAEHKWRISFDGTDHAYLKPGEVCVLVGNMFSCMAAEGVSIKAGTGDGEWYNAKHLQYIPVSLLQSPKK